MIYDARILTYNTQLRSWMMEVGAPPSVPPTYTAPTRAALIAANILRSRHDYDIVCLNEVFDESARGVLSDALRAKYPYQITKADLCFIKVVRPGLVSDIENAVLDLVFKPLYDVTALLSLKLEDSGLFLASRWPFAALPVPQAVIDAIGAQEAARLFPQGFLTTSFMPYVASTGNDARASKGVLHARIRQNAHVNIDVFMSHTQADDERVSENRGTRALQMQEAWNFIVERTGGPGFSNPTFFAGDLNFCAGLADDPVTSTTDEWHDVFNTPGQPLSDELRDQWGTFQCRGGGNPATDPGTSADVNYQPPRQRLDQFIGSPDPYVTQHVWVDWPLATAPPGIDGVSRLSDHRPLGIHLGQPHDHANPPAARKITSTNGSHRQTVQLGETVWYLFTDAGTYEFTVASDGEDDGVYYEVYVGTDLSNPQPTYRNEVDPERGERFVLVAPFFVKVGGNRFREFHETFFWHRHQGLSPDDAIHLIPQQVYGESFPPQQLNGDSHLTPWPDRDTKWFVLETPRVPTSRPLELSASLTSDDDVPVILRVIDAADPSAVVTESYGSHGCDVHWQGAPDQRFYLSVTRDDPQHPRKTFSLVADVDISLVLGGAEGNPVLTCIEETSGWGADDIALKLESDTGWQRSVSNDEIGDFEDGDPRDLWPFIPPVVSYQDQFLVVVIEEDDVIDPSDVGYVTLPGFADLRGWSGWQVIRDEPHRMTGAVRIAVDDGTYQLTCTVAKWDPRV